VAAMESIHIYETMTIGIDIKHMINMLMSGTYLSKPLNAVVFE
jgi:hypothetical protein